MDFSPLETTVWDLFLPTQLKTELHGYKAMLLALQSHCGEGLCLLFHLNVSDFEMIMGSPLNALWGNKAQKNRAHSS